MPYDHDGQVCIDRQLITNDFSALSEVLRHINCSPKNSPPKVLCIFFHSIDDNQSFLTNTSKFTHWLKLWANYNTPAVLCGPLPPLWRWRNGERVHLRPFQREIPCPSYFTAVLCLKLSPNILPPQVLEFYSWFIGRNSCRRQHRWYGEFHFEKYSLKTCMLHLINLPTEKRNDVIMLRSGIPFKRIL